MISRASTAALAAALVAAVPSAAAAQTPNAAGGEILLNADAPTRTTTAGFAYRARLMVRNVRVERVRFEVTLASGLRLRRLPASHPAYIRVRDRYLEAVAAWRSRKTTAARAAVVRRLQTFRLVRNGINAAARIDTGDDGRVTVRAEVPVLPADGTRRFLVLVEPAVPAPASFTTELTFTRAPRFARTLAPVTLTTELPGPTTVSARSR